MILSLGKRELATYVRRQLDSLFPDGASTSQVDDLIDEALGRLDLCFSATDVRTCWSEEETYFNHLHSDHYAMFLYLLSNSIFRRGGSQQLCEKLFCLNKALYGIDAFYEVELPSVFLFCHAGGTVLGRATYGDFFLVHQHCTVGTARSVRGGDRGVYPVLGRHVSLYAGAAVLGRCRIGDNCKIAVESVIMNRNLLPGTIYRGSASLHETARFPFPDNVWKATTEFS